MFSASLVVVTQKLKMWNVSSRWFWKDTLGCSSRQLVVVFVVGIIIAIIILVLHVNMFNLASVLYFAYTFHKTSCNVVKFSTTPWLPCSGCSESSGRHCSYDENTTEVCEINRRCYQSRFPCAQIQVSYEIANKSSLVSSLHQQDLTDNPYPQVATHCVLLKSNTLLLC